MKYTLIVTFGNSYSGHSYFATPMESSMDLPQWVENSYWEPHNWKYGDNFQTVERVPAVEYFHR